MFSEINGYSTALNFVTHFCEKVT